MAQKDILTVHEQKNVTSLTSNKIANFMKKETAAQHL